MSRHLSYVILSLATQSCINMFKHHSRTCKLPTHVQTPDLSFSITFHNDPHCCILLKHIQPPFKTVNTSQNMPSHCPLLIHCVPTCFNTYRDLPRHQPLPDTFSDTCPVSCYPIMSLPTPCCPILSKHIKTLDNSFYKYATLFDGHIWGKHAHWCSIIYVPFCQHT